MRPRSRRRRPPAPTSTARSAPAARARAVNTSADALAPSAIAHLLVDPASVRGEHEEEPDAERHDGAADDREAASADEIPVAGELTRRAPRRGGAGRSGGLGGGAARRRWRRGRSAGEPDGGCSAASSARGATAWARARAGAWRRLELGAGSRARRRDTGRPRRARAARRARSLSGARAFASSSRREPCERTPRGRSVARVDDRTRSSRSTARSREPLSRRSQGAVERRPS